MITYGYYEFLEIMRRYEELSEWVRLQLDAGRDKGASDELERLCQQEVGLPFSVVRHSPPEALSDLLHQGVNPRERLILLAGLLTSESELHRKADDSVGEIRASLQAFCLLGEAMQGLRPEDHAVCRPKLEKLAVLLRQVDDPYVRQKLQRFDS